MKMQFNRRDFLQMATVSPCLSFGPAYALNEPNGGLEIKQAGSALTIVLNKLPENKNVSAKLVQQAIATYISNDKTVRRPFFKDVHTPDGRRVTRNYPPDAKTEAIDHPTMHPGIWLAFGRLNGQDYWRNKAEIRQEAISIDNQKSDNICGFQVKNSYLNASGKDILLKEIANFQFVYENNVLRWSWTSEFESVKGPIILGHQEEMGMGVRFSNEFTPNKSTTKISNSEGGLNEKGTWGKIATSWANSLQFPLGASGIKIKAKSNPELKFWGHTRDYGLIVANPTSLPKQKPDVIQIESGQKLKLQFEILLYSEYTGKIENL
jgi:hypothetical protein